MSHKRSIDGYSRAASRRAPNKPIPTLTTEQQAAFWSMIDRRGPGECWPWLGSTTHGKYSPQCLYGVWHVQMGVRRITLRPHRVAYTLAVGPFPVELTIDHVKERCQLGGLCCNPAHTEPVTQSENTLRWAKHKPKVCKQRGHPKDYPGTCKECVRISLKEWREKRKQQDAEPIPTNSQPPIGDQLPPRPEVRR